MVESKESKSAPAVTRQLLENCLKLLDRNAFPHLYESALVMLAEVSHEMSKVGGHKSHYDYPHLVDPKAVARLS